MALKALNTVGGLSVGESFTGVVSANGDVTAANLNVNGLSNLGSVSNITILGGNVNSVLTTDGNGVLSWGTGSTGNSAAPMPYYIPVGEQYTVPTNFQGLFSKPIEIDGTFEVDGILIELSNIGANSSQVIFESGGDYIGHSGFTFDAASSNLALPGNVNVTGNVIPTGNITYNLGTTVNRWKDIWLSNSTIYLGEASISSDSGGNVVITTGEGGQFIVSGNTTSSPTQVSNGTSTLDVWSTTIRMIFDGANILVADATGANLYGNLTTYGNISATGLKTDNLYYANGTPFDFSNPGGITNSVQYNDNGSFGGSTNFTFTPSSNVLAVTGNITSSGTITTANLLANSTITAANLVANSTVTVGQGYISTSGTMAGIFTATITDLNIGLVANVTLGSSSGQVVVQNNLIANGNATVSGNVTTTNLVANDLYSKRAPVTVNTGTVIDTFSASAFRSVKYTIKAGGDMGYQALEVLLVHDDINSITTVYGSLSTAGVDIITLASTIVSGNVQLLATAVGANTTVNLMATYVPD